MCFFPLPVSAASTSSIVRLLAHTTIDQEFAACNKAFVEGDNTLLVQYERLQQITCSFSSAVVYYTEALLSHIQVPAALSVDVQIRWVDLKSVWF